LLEGGKDLAFWKFALVRSATREQAYIIPTGEIDEYEFYRKNRYTFYASDDYRPNWISLVPGVQGSSGAKYFGSEIRTGCSPMRPIGSWRSHA